MSSSVDSYLNLKGHMSGKHCHPAAERNKQPILEKLLLHIDKSKSGTLLEVSSGSGQHVAHFAPNFPKITFQPTEIEGSSLGSIALYAAEHSNVKPPQALDVRDPCKTWLNGSVQPDSIDYILNVNMMHISEWACSEGLFKGSGEVLKPGGLLMTYGPYAFNGVISPESNVSFDKSLRSRDPSWGLRDVPRELEPLAAKNGLRLNATYSLPANNHFLVWIKQ